MPRGAPLLAHARRRAAVDAAARAREGMTLIFCAALICVGANVTPSIGSTSTPRIGSRSRSASSAAAGSPSSRTPSAVEQPPRRLGDVVGGLRRRQALDERRELQQRVVADLRHRGVAGDAVGRDGEAEDALLGHAHAVEALVAEREHVPAPSLSR